MSKKYILRRYFDGPIAAISNDEKNRTYTAADAYFNGRDWTTRTEKLTFTSPNQQWAEKIMIMALKEDGYAEDEDYKEQR